MKLMILFLILVNIVSLWFISGVFFFFLMLISRIWLGMLLNMESGGGGENSWEFFLVLFL